MKRILILGAGKSSGVLIKHLFSLANQYDWNVMVADAVLAAAQSAVDGEKRGAAHIVSTSDSEQVSLLINSCDIVVSMLPASLHPMIAAICLEKSKHLITPSYVSASMLQMHEAATAKDLIFLNEMGLDPGIDHMSACAMIDEVKKAGGIISGFKSHCGGLISKSSDNNPWHYKFSWNPRNVVLAGQGENPIQWLEHGTKQSVIYNELFSSTRLLTTPSGEQFDSYPNRDSLSYISLYNLGNSETFYRGTLRYTGFCQSWQLLVRLGLCDDNQTLPASISTNSAVIAYLIGESNGHEISTAASKFLGVDENSEVFQRLVWLDLFDDTVKLKSSGFTPAAFLQSVLEEKWRLQQGDTDRVVMIHELEYRLDGKLYKQTAVMDRTGTLQHTAMAETVGLPIAIAVKLIAQEEFKVCGVLRPVVPSIYAPVLSELNSLGICFHHKTEAIEA